MEVSISVNCHHWALLSPRYQDGAPGPSPLLAAPAVSRSRSLTTLIRDTSANLPDADDLLHDESLASSFVDFDDFPADDLDNSANISLIQSVSLLDELDSLASTVRSLPLPTSSLSVTEWENALDTPDPRLSSHSFPGEETLEELDSLTEMKINLADDIMVSTSPYVIVDVCIYRTRSEHSIR